MIFDTERSHVAVDVRFNVRRMVLFMIQFVIFINFDYICLINDKYFVKSAILKNQIKLGDMRKFILLIVIGMTNWSVALAQEYRVEGATVVVEKIIENTGLSIKECHNKLIGYFATVWNNANRTTMLDIDDHLIYKGLLGTTTVSMGIWKYDVPATIDVAIKDNRVRIQISVSEANGHSTQCNNTYLLVSAAPVAEKHSVVKNNITKSAAEKIFENTISDIRGIILGVENAILSKSTTDW